VLEIDPPDLDDWLRGVTAERLRSIGQARGLTDAQMATHMRVSRDTFSRYKHGALVPTVAAIWRLLTSLELSWGDVLPDPKVIQVGGRESHG
jgi:transcriptional regulator with XRE-family HTH domain